MDTGIDIRGQPIILFMGTVKFGWLMDWWINLTEHSDCLLFEWLGMMFIIPKDFDYPYIKFALFIE